MGLGSRIRESGKNLFRIRIQGQKSTGSRIRIRNTAKKDGRLSRPEATSYIIITSCYSLYCITRLFSFTVSFISDPNGTIPL